MGRGFERRLKVLKAMEYPGGGLKLVESESNGFMVLTRSGEKIKVEVFDDKGDAENCYDRGGRPAADGTGVPAQSGNQVGS